jgi:hypothetical protein
MMKQMLQELKILKPHIDYSVYRTIRGQIFTGHEDAASVGIQRLKAKIQKEKTRG